MLEGETQHGSSVKKCPRRVSEDEQDSSSISIKQKRVVEDKTQAIIEWSPSGRAFKIVDVAAFSSQILSKYFRTSNFSSFQRNLNLYGFSKVRRGPDADMYAHPGFIRGCQDNLSQLRKCKSAADRKRLAAANAALIESQFLAPRPDSSSVGSSSSSSSNQESLPLVIVEQDTRQGRVVSPSPAQVLYQAMPPPQAQPATVSHSYTSIAPAPTYGQFQLSSSYYTGYPPQASVSPPYPPLQEQTPVQPLFVAAVCAQPQARLPPKKKMVALQHQQQQWQVEVQPQQDLQHEQWQFEVQPQQDLQQQQWKVEVQPQQDLPQPQAHFAPPQAILPMPTMAPSIHATQPLPSIQQAPVRTSSIAGTLHKSCSAQNLNNLAMVLISMAKC
jgi:hypothetical protein